MQLKFLNFLKRKDNKITILDDIMPSTLSPWRSYEYDNLCKNFKRTKIYTDCTTYQNYNQNKSYDENLKSLIQNYPHLDKKITLFEVDKYPKSDITYSLFYNNIKKHFEKLEAQNRNFSFTLYPGGGFGLENKEIDENLKNIFNSKNFKGVIVNQNITKKYLVDKKLCNPELINLISGVPLNLDNSEIINYKHNKEDEVTKVLFFANKYTTDGQDKGFDVFQKVVAIVSKESENIEFIVIGGFSESDIVENDAKNKIVFKGILDEFNFEKILKETHIIVSPNRPFILDKNGFDGFPLATCVTASFYGNVTMMTDYFDEAKHLKLNNESDFIKINFNPIDISNQILELHNNKDLLKTIALNGREKMLKLYSYDKQIIPRLNHFEKILNL